MHLLFIAFNNKAATEMPCLFKPRDVPLIIACVQRTFPAEKIFNQNERWVIKTFVFTDIKMYEHTKYGLIDLYYRPMRLQECLVDIHLNRPSNYTGM